MSNKILFLADNFHPPWCEGTITILRGWTYALETCLDSEVKVFSWIDETESATTCCGFRGDQNPCIIYIKPDNLCTLINFLIRYLVHPNTFIHMWYRFASIVRQAIFIQHLLKHRTRELSSYEILHVHNISQRLFIREFHRNLRNKLFISHMTSSIESLLYPSNLIKKVHGVAITSPKAYNSMKRLYPEAKAFLIPPIPFLPSRLPSASKSLITPPINVTRELDILYNLKSRGYGIILYIGNVNVYRFPQELFIKMLKKLKESNFLLLIITPPNLSNLQYLVKLERLAKKFQVTRNVLLYAKILDIYEKEKVFEIADIFIYPPSREKYLAVDPPLSLIEALVKDKYVIASAVQSVPLLIKLSEFGEIVKGNDKYYDNFVTILENAIRKDAYYGKTSSKIKDIFTPEYVAQRFKEMYQI